LGSRHITSLGRSESKKIYLPPGSTSADFIPVIRVSLINLKNTQTYVEQFVWIRCVKILGCLGLEKMQADLFGLSRLFNLDRSWISKG